MGRHKKFKMGEIVEEPEHDDPYQPQQKFVVVDYESIGDDRQYRVIPLDSKKRRRGTAVWMRAHLLESTGEKSGTASLKTYRANESLIDRGCSCQCCIHEAYDSWEWTNWGKWRSPDEDDKSGYTRHDLDVHEHPERA